MSKILIIDDEEDVLELAREILTSEGYTVKTTTNEEETTDLVSSYKPDLILLDVVLPNTSGLDICRKMKRNKDTRDIKIILFTALGTEVDMMLEKRDKADDYLLKPFNYNGLIEIVKKNIEDRD